MHCMKHATEIPSEAKVFKFVPNVFIESWDERNQTQLSLKYCDKLTRLQTVSTDRRSCRRTRKVIEIFVAVIKNEG